MCGNVNAWMCGCVCLFPHAASTAACILIRYKGIIIKSDRAEWSWWPQHVLKPPICRNMPSCICLRNDILRNNSCVHSYASVVRYHNVQFQTGIVLVPFLLVATYAVSLKFRVVCPAYETPAFYHLSFLCSLVDAYPIVFFSAFVSLFFSPFLFLVS